jgi:hypothetical protein
MSYQYFFDPTDLLFALVRKLRDIQPLVAELNGMPELINPYVDVYPENTSLDAALHHLRNPEMVVAFVGMTPSTYGQIQVQAYQYNGYFRAGADVPNPAGSATRIMNALLWGLVSENQQPLQYQPSESWVPGVHLLIRDLPVIQRQQDREGLDLWTVSFEFLRVAG